MHLLGQFDDVHAVDWTLNAVIYAAMAIGLAVAWLWRARVFEAAVDAAAEGQPVGLRAAYNQFWLTIGGLAAVVLLAGAGLAFFDIKKLLIAG